MMDLSDKVSDSEEMSSQNPTPERPSSDGTKIKTCFDCGTSKTPLWRGGPAGPKSLCNACGIRSRKKRRALLGLNKEEKKTKKSTSTSIRSSITNININSISSNSSSGSGGGGDDNSSSIKICDSSLKKKLIPFGRDFVLQRPRSNTSQRRKLGEVEQAAFLLMALSCGSVYA